MSTNRGLPPKHARRALVRTLLVAATIVCFAGALSVWVNRQALNTGNWTKTSSALLADHRVDDALGGYLVDQLFGDADVAAALQQRLPGRLQGLAGPAAAALREVADRAAPRLLTRPRVQGLWESANRAAHQRLMQIVSGGGANVSTGSGDVTLDLHALVGQLAGDLGIQRPGGASGSRIALPPDAGKLVIMRSDQLRAAQDIANAIRGLAILLPALALALFALAVWLARGWRGPALRATGGCLAVVGLALVLIRRVGGNAIANTLVEVPSNKSAAHAVWNIATSLLHTIAVALIVYAVLIVLSAWLAGPSRSATRVRTALAPSLRDRPGVAYGSVGTALLLVVAWGPTPAFREPAAIAVFAALLSLGVTALRRQTAREAG